jgi:hypothetical protein
MVTQYQRDDQLKIREYELLQRENEKLLVQIHDYEARNHENERIQKSYEKEIHDLKLQVQSQDADLQSYLNFSSDVTHLQGNVINKNDSSMKKDFNRFRFDDQERGTIILYNYDSCLSLLLLYAGLMPSKGREGVTRLEKAAAQSLAAMLLDELSVANPNDKAQTARHLSSRRQASNTTETEPRINDMNTKGAHKFISVDFRPPPPDWMDVRSCRNG